MFAHTITFLYTDGEVSAGFAVHTHQDADNDGKCDGCGSKMTGGGRCPLCGRIHDKHTFRGAVTGWLHALAYYGKIYVLPVLKILAAPFVTMFSP